MVSRWSWVETSPSPGALICKREVSPTTPALPQKPIALAYKTVFFKDT